MKHARKECLACNYSLKTEMTGKQIGSNYLKCGTNDVGLFWKIYKKRRRPDVDCWNDEWPKRNWNPVSPSTCMARETVFTEKTSWENKVTFMKTRLRKFFGDSVNQGVTQTFLYYVRCWYRINSIWWSFWSSPEMYSGFSLRHNLMSLNWRKLYCFLPQ